MFGRNCRWNGLRHEVLFFPRQAEIKRPTMHGRKLFSKITMSRRGGYGPFQCRGVPRIALGCAFPDKDAEKEIDQENDLSRAQNKGGNGDKHVHRLLGLEKHVLGRVVDAPHLTADSNNMHWKKDAIRTDKR